MNISEADREAIQRLLAKQSGPLPIEAIAQGIESCLQNAIELTRDALALIGGNRLPRAMSLLISAMEEIGKVSVISAMARIPTENSGLWADAWSNFRSHEAKTTFAFGQTYDDLARANPGLLMGAAHLQESLSPLAERMRQVGLYVDYLGSEDGWLSPTDVGAVEVEQWLNRVQTALDRTLALFNEGLYSLQSLTIQHEIYAPLNINRPRRKQLTEDVARALLESFNAAHPRYIARLLEAGVLNPETSLQMFGMPATEFARSGV